MATLIDEFAERVGDPAFPCVFAGPSLDRDEILFGLCDEDGVIPLMRMAAGAITRTPDQVVVLFVEFARAGSLGDERELAASILRRLLGADRVPWPPDAPTDPKDPRWVLWFEGVDFFVNFSTPGHRRRSRNLGSAVTMVVQARSLFDQFAGPDNRVRARIRSRVGSYDGIPVHPAVGCYGDHESREIVQYFLGDRNDVNIDLLA